MTPSPPTGAVTGAGSGGRTHPHPEEGPRTLSILETLHRLLDLHDDSRMYCQLALRNNNCRTDADAHAEEHARVAAARAEFQSALAEAMEANGVAFLRRPLRLLMEAIDEAGWR